VRLASRVLDRVCREAKATIAMGGPKFDKEMLSQMVADDIPVQRLFSSMKTEVEQRLVAPPTPTTCLHSSRCLLRLSAPKTDLNGQMHSHIHGSVPFHIRPVLHLLIN
jgi:hypothetical protein